MAVSNEQLMQYAKLGAMIGVGFIVFQLIRKAIIKRKVLREFGDIRTITNNKRGNKGGFTIPQNVKTQTFQSRSYAQRLYDAMKGLATDEDLIWTTLEPLTTEQRNKVRNYFNTYFGNGESLDQWFADDLSGKDLQRARAYFN